MYQITIENVYFSLELKKRNSTNGLFLGIPTGNRFGWMIRCYSKFLLKRLNHPIIQYSKQIRQFLIFKKVQIFTAIFEWREKETI